MTTVDDRERLRLLYELGRAFAACTELDALARLVVGKCTEVMDAEGASILLLDPASNELYFPYVAHADPAVRDRLLSLRFPADRGIAGEALRSGHPIRVDDVNSDPRFYTGVDTRTGTTTRSILTVPLRAPQGTIGVVQVLNHRGEGGFSVEDLAFLEALSGSIAVAIENARLYDQTRAQLLALQVAMQEHEQLIAIRKELDIAGRIQQSILPRDVPPFPDRREFDLFGAMIPAREVGGDFFDCFLIDQSHLGLVVGDVSGKGVPAAIFMAVSRTLLRATAGTAASPAACLQRVNELLIPDNDSEMFVTVFYGVLDVRTGALAFSNGGHPPPLLRRSSGAVVRLERTSGMVLGVMPDITYGDKQITLEPGDCVVVYSDGVSEAMDRNDSLFSDERVEAELAQLTVEAPAEIVDGLIEIVRRYAGDVPQSDDITVLAVTYRG